MKYKIIIGREIEITTLERLYKSQKSEAGLSPIANPEKYAMAIQCGGCMSTRKQLLNRTNLFVHSHIPISNYGMALAYMNGIFERVMAPFVGK